MSDDAIRSLKETVNERLATTNGTLSVFARDFALFSNGWIVASGLQVVLLVLILWRVW